MNPILCAHCGINFMRKNPQDELKLCNSGIIRERIRKPNQEDLMDTIDMIITCPIPDHRIIEEICINRGIDYTQYFLELHHEKNNINREEKDEEENFESEHIISKKGRKK